MADLDRSELETDRTRTNQRRPYPPQHREDHDRPPLKRSHATNCLRRAYHEPESRSQDEAGVPNEPPQGKDVDRGGDAVVLLIQPADDQTHKRLDHVREYQVHVQHPVERPKSIEVQLCHVDDENC
ncbi:uncharacterized protein FSUBG_10110 [Fusarium subglutinans]|uniref:Uncharacterized protein n=1 Tax=Gibberella subglutinans TaxID=42677 RepID=A0A8H5P9J7_GIBSU|nr:uncharacterized protein FSUBG_10110 [Fusarium subglutinans]KAF5592632.1 hypothetical protein FSUBG_10110 [Fusarium subglutinans]